MVKRAAQSQNSDSGSPINRLAEATAGIASQERPETLSARFKSSTTNTLIFHGKNEEFELFADIFQITRDKMHPKMSEAKNINHFQSHFQKKH